MTWWLFLPSSGSVHVLDGSEIRPVHQPLCFSHHCVPVGALHLLGSHVTDITVEQEAWTAAVALLCCSCWDLVTGWVVNVWYINSRYSINNKSPCCPKRLLISFVFYSSDGGHWHLLLEEVFVAWRSSFVVQHYSQQKLQLGNILSFTRVLPLNCLAITCAITLTLYWFTITENHQVRSPRSSSSLTLFSPVNLSLSVVLLLCVAPRPGLHAALRAPRPPWQADEAAAAAHRGLHPHLLVAAPQGDALHHIHLPCAQPGGCPRLFFHVSLSILPGRRI